MKYKRLFGHFCLYISSFFPHSSHLSLTVYVSFLAPHFLTRITELFITSLSGLTVYRVTFHSGNLLFLIEQEQWGQHSLGGCEVEFEETKATDACYGVRADYLTGYQTNPYLPHEACVGICKPTGIGKEREIWVGSREPVNLPVAVQIT